MEKETKINYGYIPPVIKPEDHVLGQGKTPLILLQHDGQWDKEIERIDEIQKNAFIDSADCTGYGLENQIVPYMKRRYRLDVNYSERAIGIVAGTRPPGNSPDIVYQSNRSFGFIKNETLPFTEDIKTIEEFYSPDPLTFEIEEEGKKWKEQFEFFHEWVWSGNPTLEEKVHNMKVSLKYSTLAIDVYAWATDENGIYIKLGQSNHWVCVYGYTDKGWKVYDSYDRSHKIYSFENDIGFCKRISIEKRESKPSKISFWQSIINFIKKIFK